MSTPAGGSFIERARRLDPSVVTSVLETSLVLAPFAFTGYLIAFRLKPVEMPDSFAYLWHGPPTFAYFTGRALTQRVLYSLGGGAPAVIVRLQLVCAAASAVVMYRLLRAKAGAARNLVLAGLVALVATSFNFAIGNIVLDPDPLALYLGLGFPFVLVLCQGPARPFVIVAVGVLAIFSRSTEPAIVLAQMAAFIAGTAGVVAAGTASAVAAATTSAVVAGKPTARTRFGPLVLVAGAALFSAALTGRYDTSVGLNAANDVFQRVLPDPALLEHYRVSHGLPSSASIDAFRGANVLVRPHGRPIFVADHRTRNYALTPNDDPFLLWIESKGWHEYWTHLVVHAPWTTGVTLAKQLEELYAPVSVTIRADYAESRANDRAVAKNNAAVLLGSDFHEVTDFDEHYYLEANPDVAEAVRRGGLPSGRAHYDRFGRAEGRLANPSDVAQRRIPPGLLGFDPLASLTALFAACRLARLPVLLLLIPLGLSFARRRPEAPCVLLGVTLLVGGLVGFFFGYFGDAMDCERHVSAAVITLTLGLAILLAGALLALARSMSGRSGYGS